MNAREPLAMWVIYGRPRDYPDQYVARKWLIGTSKGGGLTKPERTTLILTADTLAELRKLLPPGLTRLPREPDDDLAIVETWL